MTISMPMNRGRPSKAVMRSTARWSGVVLWWCSAWSRAIDRMVSSICAGRSGGGTFVSDMAYPQLCETTSSVLVERENRLSRRHDSAYLLCADHADFAIQLEEPLEAENAALRQQLIVCGAR